MKRLTTKPARYVYDPQQILYLTGHVNYCFIHLANQEVVLACGTLKEFAARWPSFLRVHKRVLINPTHLKRVKTNGKAALPCSITMTDQAELKIARRRRLALQQALMQTKSTD